MLLSMKRVPLVPRVPEWRDGVASKHLTFVQLLKSAKEAP
jgi:hypothetical protein